MHPRLPHAELEFSNIDSRAAIRVCHVKGTSFNKRTSCLAFPMIRYAANSSTENCLVTAVVTLDVIRAGKNWAYSPDADMSGWVGLGAYLSGYSDGYPGRRKAILEYYHDHFDVAPGGTPSTEM